MVKHLPVIIVSVVVFGGSFYGGQMAARISADAFLKAAPTMDPTCRALRSAESELATARQAIGVIDTYLGPDREVRGLAGPYPQEALPPEVVTALVAEALGAETVKYVMCTEYPCIAIIPEAPLAAALQPLRDKGLDPLLVDVGRNQALLLPMAGWLDLPPELDNEESRAQQYVRAERAKLRAQALSNGLVALAKADDAVLDHQKAP